MDFKGFLLTEEKNYFTEKVNEILEKLQDLITSGGKQIGARILNRHAEGVVTLVRKVLHTTWPANHFKYLKKLQKCGVAIMRCIDEKGDLEETLHSVLREVENVIKSVGEPVNDLGNAA